MKINAAEIFLGLGLAAITTVQAVAVSIDPDMINEGLRFGIIAFGIAVSALLVVKEWRKDIGYFFAAWIFGTVIGYSVSLIPPAAPFAVLATIAGVILGPVTIQWSVRRSPPEFVRGVKDAVQDSREIIDAVKEAAKKKGGK